VLYEQSLSVLEQIDFGKLLRELWANFTEEELRIVAELIAGMSRKEIAESQGTSEDVVSYKVNSVEAKLHHQLRSLNIAKKSPSRHKA
jgi:DNA-binding CsgD family transcriptional regulator